MLKSFFNWIKPSLEGPDGKVSHRKITVFHCMLILTFMVLSIPIWGVTYPEIVWLVFSGGAGIFSSLGIAQTLANKKKDENTNTDYKHTDTTL